MPSALDAQLRGGLLLRKAKRGAVGYEVHDRSFDLIEVSVKPKLRPYPKDRRRPFSDYPKMPRSKKLKPTLRTRWYLQEWMQHFGLKQADLQKKLGWSLGKASEVYNGQPDRQELVEEVAGWLEIEPYEFLLPPERAALFKRMLVIAHQIAQDAGGSPSEESAPIRKVL